MRKEYNVGDVVYHVTDDDNEPLLIVGVCDRGNHYTYFVRNKYRESEYFGIEISKEKTHIT